VTAGPRTWKDVQMAGRNCPVIHQMIALVALHGLTKEQALIEAVLALSEARELLLGQVAELLQQVPVRVPGGERRPVGVPVVLTVPGRGGHLAEAQEAQAAARRAAAAGGGPAHQTAVARLIHSSAQALAAAGIWTVEQAEFGLKRLLNSRLRLDQAMRLMVAYGQLQPDADADTRQKMLEELTNPDHQ